MQKSNFRNNCKLGRESIIDSTVAYDDLAKRSHIVQFGASLMAAERDISPVFALIGNPELGAAFTTDSGLFMSENDSIKVKFITFYFDWSGIRLETWNDRANYTDYGPTYGFSVSIDLFKLHRM